MGKDEVITATIIIKDLSSQRNIEYPYDNMKTIEEYKKQGVECVTFYDERYPYLLKEISTPPFCLYCKGNIQLLNTFCIFLLLFQGLYYHLLNMKYRNLFVQQYIQAHSSFA